MAEYRTLERDESPPVALWTDVFGVEEPFFTSLLGDEDLSFAAFEKGKAVSSVHVFVREIRDREGRPLKVGGIGSVSTHPDHRKHGHSGQLLEMAIEGMERAGCVWSLLGTGVNDHYARYGWRTVSTPHRTGSPRPGSFSGYGTSQIIGPNAAIVNEMARLHAETTATQPMATVRSPLAWQTAVRYRLSPDQATVFASSREGRMVAYLVVRGSGQSVRYAEIAGEPASYRDLLVSVAAALNGYDVKEIVFDLPPTPELTRAFEDAVAGLVRLNESRGTMLRPIADRISWPDLLALYGDPRGRHGELDAF